MLNLVDVIDGQYRNNIVKQTHIPIKQEMHQALGWKYT